MGPLASTASGNIDRSHRLDGVALFESLDAHERARIAQRCRWRRYSKDAEIIDRDSDSHDVYFIVEGRARVVNHAASGREISFEDIDEGGFFGELSAIDGQPRSASVVALTDALLAALPAQSFLNVLADHPEVALVLMRRLSAMVRRTSDRIMELSTHGAQTRVVAEVLRQALAATTDGRTAVIDPTPFHNEIASRVSTTRETVARVMGELHKTGITRKKGHALVVPDLKRLSELAQELPDH